MNYYKELPEGYKKIYQLDAEDSKFMIWINIISILIAVILFVLIIYIKNIDKHIEITQDNFYYIFIAIIVLILYVFVHELIHGLFYKIFTREKLTFGFKLTVCYCGVPHLYIKKWPMIITAIAPFILLSILFVLGMIFTDGLLFILIAILAIIHFVGCCGDIFISFKILFSGKNLLINDTGPIQTIYKKE